MENLNQDAVNMIAKRMFFKPTPTDIPKILCRRNTPHPLTYPLFDKSWESMRIVMENGRPVREITHDRHVKINTNNMCEIPDTPNNRERLNRISKPRVEKQVRTVHNEIKGKDETVVEEILIPPQYEILEENLLHENVYDEVAKRVARIMKGEVTEETEYREAAQIPEEPQPEDGVSPLPKRRGRPPGPSGKSTRQAVTA